MTVSSLSARDIGKRIRKIRGNLSQSEFARQVGVPNQNGVSRYEGGRIPHPELLVRIARFGKVSVDWILTGRSFEGSSLAAERPSAYRVTGTRPPGLPALDELTPTQKRLVVQLVRALGLKNR